MFTDVCPIITSGGRKFHAPTVYHNVVTVEDVAFADEPRIRKGRKGTRYMLGYTAAGRYLFIVYILKGKETARVITAMDMDDRAKKLYKKGGK